MYDMVRPGATGASDEGSLRRAQSSMPLASECMHIYSFSDYLKLS